MHGQYVSVPEGVNHVHIKEGPDVLLQRAIRESQTSTEDFGLVQSRDGMYSAVAQRPNDFEWDGWVSHD